jgi:hypothetical protein
MSFDAKDFRWAGPAAYGSRVLVYIGFKRIIRIEVYSLPEGGYALGPMSEPMFTSAEQEAFEKCGGFPVLSLTASWVANSR